MSNKSWTAQREVGQTAPTSRGFEIIDRKNNPRLRNFSFRSSRTVFARTTSHSSSIPEEHARAG
jgi:hypothetical protein